jgi:hypothetical protein
MIPSFIFGMSTLNIALYRESPSIIAASSSAGGRLSKKSARNQIDSGRVNVRCEMTKPASELVRPIISNMKNIGTTKIIGGNTNELIKRYFVEVTRELYREIA